MALTKKEFIEASAQYIQGYEMTEEDIDIAYDDYLSLLTNEELEELDEQKMQ